MKPEGWHIDMLPTTPDKLKVGERRLVIPFVGSAVIFVAAVAPRCNAPFVVIAIGVGFFVASMALVNACWRLDPWMTRTLERFLSYPAFIPAHAVLGASAKKRAQLRGKAHLRR